MRPLCLGLLLLMYALPAVAREAAPLPPFAESSVPPAMVESGQAAMVEGLSGAGLSVRPSADVAAALPEGLRSCQNSPCVVQAREALGVALVAFLRIFEVSGGHSVSVLLSDGSGTAYQGSGYVTAEATVQDAVHHALSEALDKQARGRGPWLSVEGSPEGATVVVNGEPVGRIPATLRVTPGPLQLQVRQPGYQPFSRLLNVGADEDQHEVVGVQLQPAAQAVLVRGPETVAPTRGAGADAGGARPSVWNDIIGVAALVGGAVYGGVAVAALLRDGNCTGTTDSMGRCARRATLGTHFWTQVGASAALLAGGTLMLVVQPIPGAESPADGAVLQLRGRL